MTLLQIFCFLVDWGLGAGNSAKYPVQHAKKSAKKQPPPKKKKKNVQKGSQKKVKTN